jgi:predicted ATPase
VIADYEHGCWFVALDALRDPELVPSTIADALNVRVAPDRSVMTSLEDFLAHRQLLLVLDNFEQVTAAAPNLGDLLRAAPGLRLLTTSRAPLHIHGEQEYPVPPLGIVPELRAGLAPTAESLSQYEAVQLFIERALAVKPDFRVTNANAPAVAEICDRLDGLPLAIELAAARIKLLTPEEMLGRLQQSLSILSSAAPDLPERQRTLLGAIAWSHGLLSGPERRLFARLAVFRGGFTLDAAEIVCGGDELGVEVLAGVGALLDMSLLRSEEQAGETWFRMLGTMRAYASDRLAESGEIRTVQVRHARHFFGLAALAEGQLNGSRQLEWLERLGRAQDNLRAAWSRVADLGLLGPALRAAGAIWRFWQLRGQFSEARATFERLLALPGAPAADRGKALIGAGGIAYWQGDFESMARYYRGARELAESAGDLGLLADALYNESYIPFLEGDVDAARSLLTRALDLYRQTGNAIGMAEAESSLGFSHFFNGELQAAIPFQERAVRTYRAANAQWQLSESLLGLSGMHARAGDWRGAVATMRESLRLARALAVDVGVAMIVEWAGASAAWVGDLERGARLLGKADEMKQGLGAAAPSQLVQTGAHRSRARDALGEDRYEQLRSEGAGLSTDDAIRLVEEFEPAPNAPPAPSPRPLGMAEPAEEAREAI